jgi:outer membrane protein assembly factor BamB
MSWSMRRTVLVLLAVGVVAAAICIPHTSAQVERQARAKVAQKDAPPAPKDAVPKGVGPGGLPGGEKDPSEFSHALSLPRDNDKKRQLEAAEDYIRISDWGLALPLLQKLVSTREDVFAQIERAGPDGKKKPVMVSVKAEASRLIGTLPKEGMDSYKVKYGVDASEDLKKARAAGDPAMLAEVMRLYLYTDAGAEAANLLGTYHLDRGEYVAADLCFGKLLDRAGADNLPPDVLFKAAMALHMQDDPAARAREEEAWKKLHGRVRELVVRGEPRSVAELQEYVATMTRGLGNRNQKDYAMVFGNPSRNGQLFGEIPFMHRRWQQQLADLHPKGGSPSGGAAASLRNAESYLHQRGQAIIPANVPVTATVTKGDKQSPLIIYRTYGGVQAVELKNGKLAWESGSKWSLDGLLGDTKTTAPVGQWLTFYAGQNMQRPAILFENSVLGSLSTDNQYVYAVEDLAVPPPAHFQNVNFNPGGNPYGYSADLLDAIRHSRLLAIHAGNGRLEWQVPDPRDKEDGKAKTELDDCYFLGPPLPMAGKLYVLIEKQQELRLVCLDPAQKGKVLSSQALATTRDKMQQDIARRTEAAHLAYGEGVLVCPTNAGAVLGIDLLTNSLLWAYPYREKSEPAQDQAEFGGMAFPPGGGPVPIRRRGGVVSAGIPLVSQWKVTPPVIQDGKVVFAAPDATSVHCVNLRDGSPVWSQKRAEDDLYLAGVFAGKVLVVGKKGVKAYKLSNGAFAWEKRELETGMPSGFGIASDNVYYLPLKEAGQEKAPEICAIDVDKGEIIAHTKARKLADGTSPEPPGNLVFYEGDVLSQSYTEVVAYPQLKVKIAQMQQTLAANPNDPVGLTELGELHLDQGKLAEAVADLKQALEHVTADTPPAVRGRARAKLYETLTEYFQRDFPKAEEAGYLPTYGELCQVKTDDLPEGKTEGDAAAETRRRTANFLCLVAAGKEKQGKLVEAFEKYQEFSKAAGGQELISVVDEPTVKANPDAWSEGRIKAMLARATPDQRKPLEDLVARQWEQVRQSGSVEDVRKFVAVFGSQFPVGKQARLHLAERLMEDAGPNALLDAERHLLLLRGPGEEPEVSGRALEALARLMTRKGLLDDAAYYYRKLRADYAGVKVRDGKTGADLYDEVATDKRLLPHLDEAPAPASTGQIKSKEERGGFPWAGQQTYQFEQDGEPLPFFRRYKIALQVGYHQVKVIDRNTGEERWSQNLTRTNFQNLMWGGGQPNNAPRFTYANLGHLVVLPVANMVFGLDPVNRKLLWEKNLIPNLPVAGQPGTTGPPAWNNIMLDPRDGSIQLTYPDGWMQRVGGTGPLEGATVCLQTRDGLLALDPVTGRTLWTRSGIGSRSHVFGDDKHVYVVEMGGDTQNQTAASTRVLRAADGVTVKGVPDFASLYSKRVRLIGRNILLSDTDDKGRAVLRLHDPLEARDVWKETFPANSHVLRSETTPHLAGMVEPDGKVRVWDLRTQKQVLNGKMDPKDLEKAHSVTLLSDLKDFYVAVNKPADPNLAQFGGVQPNLMQGTGLRSLPVNGEFYAFDGATGKVKWHNTAVNEMLILDQFRELPMVLFTARYVQWINGQRQQQQVVSLLAIDKRTGKRLFQDEDERGNKRLQNTAQFHAVNLDTKAGKVELISQNLKVTFYLNGEPTKVEGGEGAKTSSAAPIDVREEKVRALQALQEAERMAREAEMIRIRRAAEKK